MRKNLFIWILIILSAFYAYNKWFLKPSIDMPISPDLDTLDEPDPRQAAVISTMPIQEEKGEWRLRWYDEFDGKELNQDFWTMQTGWNCWGNNELQYYTDRPDNCILEDGKLVIRALKEDYQGSRYTSARVTTKGKVDFLFGKIDIKAKLPTGKGLLPSFWLMPSENYYDDRKKNGEIDIMEMLGDKPGIIYGVTHYSLEEKNKSFKKFNSKDPKFPKDFHIYSLEWSAEELKWLIDDKAYYTLDLDKTFHTDYNPFNKSFYLIMNTAVGGDWPGEPAEDTPFPAALEIDYIKYYEKK